MLKDLEKLEGRMFSIEKTVGMRTPTGDLAAQLPDRAASSGANANFRELNLKLEKILVEHEKFAKWAPNPLVASMRNRLSLLIECRGCKAEGGPRRSIDHQGLIPRRTGMKQLTRSIGSISRSSTSTSGS